MEITHNDSTDTQIQKTGGKLKPKGQHSWISSSFRSQIIFLLQERDSRESKGFAELFQNHERLFDNWSILRAENLRLSLAVERSLSDKGGGGISEEREKQLEQKILKLQEEVTELHRRRGENASQVLALSAKLTEREAELDLNRTAAATAVGKNADLEEQVKFLQSCLQEREATNELLRDEHQALHLAYTSLEDKHRWLTRENQELLQRYIEVKAKHADVMNQENENFVKHKQAQVRKELEEAAAEMKIVTLPSGSSPPKNFVSPSDITLLSSLGIACTIPCTPSKPFEAHESEVTAVRWNPNGKHFATAGQDRKVKIWEPGKADCPELKATLTGSGGSILCLDFDSSGTYLLAASHDFACRIWTVDDGRIRTTQQTVPSGEPEALGIVLRRNYLKVINIFATIPCQCCDRLLYPFQKHSCSVTSAVSDIMASVEANVPVGNVLCLCHSCKVKLSKGKMPNKMTQNGLYVDPIPQELESLTEVELRLISQVKLHMKIFTLCKGRGQQAMKGLVIHFPQSVEEVVEQLPIQPADSGLMFVHESLEQIGLTKEYEIRPAYVFTALRWLKQNNPLYAHVTIDEQVNLEPESIVINKCINNNVVILQSETRGWKALSKSRGSILRATIHQGNASIFGDTAGRQCTAMAASFIAHSCIQAASTWTSETLLTIMLTGNAYYREKQTNEAFLNVEEIEGVIIAYESISIQLEIGTNVGYQGYLNKYPGDGVNRLEDQLAAFFCSSSTKAIMQTNSYSMALIREDDMVYFADSHSRGAAGYEASNGKACVLCYNLQEAAHTISALIHRVCQPKQYTDQTQACFLFTITPINATVLETAVLQDVTGTTSRTSITNQTPEVCSSTNASDGVFASVIAPDYFNEPSFDDVYENGVHNLNRNIGKPLYHSNEPQLDLLGFFKLFPYGRFGLNSGRPNKISTLDYFQQRIMSSDKRFESDTEYLFYACNECDRARLEERISVCCAMTTEGRDQHDPRIPEGACQPSIYMSAIRGSANYWQKFCGDLIAMVVQLGTPTFFVTTSFDDLNAPDVITALYKAEYGGDSEPPHSVFNDFDLKRKLLKRHPVTAARHFSYRLNKLKALLRRHAMEIFGKELIDFAYRIEFQARGSPHCHSILWLKDAPEFSTVEGEQFLEANISCSLDNRVKDLVQRYQCHKHTHTCFKNGKHYCRFGFPRPVRDNLEILHDSHDIQNNGGRFVNLKRRAEEQLVNNYHPVLLEVLQCNMDIQPVTSTMAIVFYIAKYMSKCEPQEIRAEVKDAIAAIYASDMSIREKMRRSAFQIMKRREISAQEAAFRVCSLSLRHCSRKTVFIPTFPKEERLRMVRMESYRDDNPQFGISLIDRYCARPDSLESICLYEFAAYFEAKYYQKTYDEDVLEGSEEHDEEQNHVIERVITLKDGKGKINRRTLPAAVKTIRFNPEVEREKYFYSLVLLYFPFREENFCNLTDSQHFFELNHHLFRTHQDDHIIRIDLQQEIDRALLFVNQYMDVSIPEEQANDSMREFNETIEAEDNIFIPQTVPNGLQTLMQTLNVDQRRVFNDIQTHCQNKEAFRFVCVGAGGCGKSYLINTISSFLRTYSGDPNSVLIAAPTGKAAFNVGGITIHKAFSLLVEHGSTPKYQKLSARKLANMRLLYRKLRWIILDEFSMINYDTLRQIHLRLTDIMNNDEPFGGLSVFMFGDLMQLPPVRGSWIFTQPSKYSAEPDLWATFQQFEIQANERQNGADDLLGICNRLRVGQLTLEDITTLRTRLIDKDNPAYEELIKNFEDSIRIFNKNKDVDAYNRQMSSRLASKGVKHTLTGHSAKVNAARFMLDSSRVVSGGYDRTLKIWDLKSRACVSTKFAGSSCHDLVSLPDNNNVISCHYDRRIRFWDLRTDSPTQEVTLADKVTSLDLSLNQNYLLASVRDDSLHILDLRMNTVMAQYSADGFKVSSDISRAVFSPDAQWAASGSMDGSIFFWNVMETRVEMVLKEHASAVGTIHWHPKGFSLVSGDKSKKVLVWAP